MKTVSVELSSVKNITESSLLVHTIGRYTFGRQLVLIDIYGNIADDTRKSWANQTQECHDNWECSVNFILL